MKQTQIQIRCTEEQRELVRTMAERHGFESMSSYILSLVERDADVARGGLTLDEISQLRQLLKKVKEQA